MNRIASLFQRKQSGILSVYMTAGYPGAEDTIPILKALEAAGADMVEIGIPFSDPLADGPVIQESSQVALKNGMTLHSLYDQLKEVRKHVSFPLVLMGYLNPILQYGMESFIAACKEIGVDGVIIPDLPLAEYKKEYKEMFDSAGICFSMLITPMTSEDRVKEIAGETTGFLYMVADSATTGAKGEISQAQISYFQRIADMNLDVPRVIGFGISNRENFQRACNFANGAIIGSAFITALNEGEEVSLEKRITRFVLSVLSTHD